MNTPAIPALNQSRVELCELKVSLVRACLRKTKQNAMQGYHPRPRYNTLSEQGWDLLTPFPTELKTELKALYTQGSLYTEIDITHS